MSRKRVSPVGAIDWDAGVVDCLFSRFTLAPGGGVCPDMR